MKKKEVDNKAKELLKKAVESLEEQPEETAAPAPEEKQKPVLSDKRKRALISYMAILFAVAFLLVALSLAIQYRDSRAQITTLGATANSALEKADQLQETNRLLQAQLDEATASQKSLEKELAEAQADLRSAEEAKADLSSSNQEILQEKMSAEHQANAYKLLAQALSAQSRKDVKALRDSLTALEKEIDYLDEADLPVYQTLVRQLEEVEETGEVE